MESVISAYFKEKDQENKEGPTRILCFFVMLFRIV